MKRILKTTTVLLLLFTFLWLQAAVLAASDPAGLIPDDVYVIPAVNLPGNPDGFDSPEYIPYIGFRDVLSDMPPYAPPAGSLRVLDVSEINQNKFLGTGDKTWTVVPTADGTSDALYWRTPATNGQVYCPDIAVHDFSDYTAIECWMYSEIATGDSFSFLFYGEGDLQYFRYPIIANWSGWKKISFSLSDCDSVRDCSWGNINSIRLNSSGWGSTLVEDNGKNHLYLSDVYLTKSVSDYETDLGDVTADDLDAVMMRWKTLLAGNYEINTYSADTSAKIRQINVTARDYASTMQSGPDIRYLWKGLENFTTNGYYIQRTYERLYAMAAAWATWGGELYHDPDLLLSIKEGLQWMSENVYNEDTVSSGNWWEWQIGAPLGLGRCVLLIEEELTDTEIRFYLRGLDHFTPLPGMTYANRAWTAYVAMIAAVCERDADRLARSVAMLMNVFTYTQNGDGFYVDGSFIQHDATPYIAGYGGTYFEFMSDIFYVLRDTKFDVGEGYVQQYAEQFFRCCLPLMLDGGFAPSVMGRTVLQGTGAGAAANICMSMAKIVDLFSPVQQKQFYENVLYFVTNNETFRSTIETRLTFFNLYEYREMMKLMIEGKIVPKPMADYAKVYGSMDRVMRSGGSYNASISFSSTRIYRYEAINGENGKGWYMGDGALFVYTANDDYNLDYFRAINWHFIPGTTVTTAPRTETNIKLGNSLKGAYAYAGGAYLGTSVAAGMHYHGLTKEQAALVDGVSADLDAYKGYFLFGDTIVCLGAGITSKEKGVGVITTVDQRRSNGEAIINGERVTLGSIAARTGVSWIYSAGFGGYWFPESGNISIGMGENGMQHIRFNHGAECKNESYVYVMLPNMTEQQVADYVADPRVRVLANTTTVMAVREMTTGETGYLFYKANSFDGIATSGAAAMMTRENADGSMTYSISDPTQLQQTLVVNLLGEHEVVSADSHITVTVMNGYTQLVIDTNRAQGGSFNITLR